MNFFDRGGFGACLQGNGVPESLFAEALRAAVAEGKLLIESQVELARQVGRPKREAVLTGADPAAATKVQVRLCAVELDSFNNCKNLSLYK